MFHRPLPLVAWRVTLPVNPPIWFHVISLVWKVDLHLALAKLLGWHTAFVPFAKLVAVSSQLQQQQARRLGGLAVALDSDPPKRPMPIIAQPIDALLFVPIVGKMLVFCPVRKVWVKVRVGSGKRHNSFNN